MFAVMLAHFIFQLLFLSFPCFNGFHYYYCYYFFILVYFDRLPLNDFKCDWCPCFVLSSFYLLSLRWGLVAGLRIPSAMGVVPSGRG